MYNYEIPYELAKKIRASIFLTGPLLARFHKVYFYNPGGCDIGARPIDIHLNGFKCFNIESSISEHIYCRCDKLNGCKINLRYKSVGATENLLMLSVLSNGKTTITNCAKEPEVVCLANFLNLCGAKIKGAGTSVIEVEGVKKLKSLNLTFMPISDRIETGTYLLMLLSVGGEICIKNADFLNNLTLIKKIQNNACKLSVFNDKIYMKSCGSGNCIKYTKTGPYPEFPTDLQSQLCSYLSTQKGLSIVEETVFDNRFKQLEELVKMGANIHIKSNKAFIKGVKKLYGKSVYAYDLRGGASMILAGLSAEGVTTIDNSEVIDRGYFEIENKLSLLGANIKRV